MIFTSVAIDGTSHSYFNFINYRLNRNDGIRHEPPAAAQVCRQLRTEILPIYYSNLTFCPDAWAPLDCVVICRWLKGIDEHHIQQIRKWSFSSIRVHLAPRDQDEPFRVGFGGPGPRQHGKGFSVYGADDHVSTKKVQAVYEQVEEVLTGREHSYFTSQEVKRLVFEHSDTKDRLRSLHNIAKYDNRGYSYFDVESESLWKYVDGIAVETTLLAESGFKT